MPRDTRDLFSALFLHSRAKKHTSFYKQEALLPPHDSTSNGPVFSFSSKKALKHGGERTRFPHVSFYLSADK